MWIIAPYREYAIFSLFYCITLNIITQPIAKFSHNYQSSVQLPNCAVGYELNYFFVIITKLSSVCIHFLLLFSVNFLLWLLIFLYNNPFFPFYLSLPLQFLHYLLPPSFVRNTKSPLPLSNMYVSTIYTEELRVPL